MPLQHLVSQLPEHLLERIRWIQPSTSRSIESVVYWMQTAIRADENPALDVAISIAHQLSVPLLVYQGLSQRYQYASDRHHTFLLQGAKDVASDLATKGISYALHVERPNACDNYLVQLAKQSGLIITEDMPTHPSKVFRMGLKRSTDAAILAVDTACVAPMQCVGQAYERAFQFRSETAPLYRTRLARAWPELELTPHTFDLSQLPFEAIDITRCDIPRLVQECEIRSARACGRAWRR